jgi:stress response protein YsnF
MIADDADELRVPLLEERVQIEKVAVETDHVRVRTIVEKRTDIIDEVLKTGWLDVSHVRLDREVSELPEPRQEGDTLIVSIVEERLVKRLFLVEEVHVTRSSNTESVTMPVSLRRMRAVVEQDGADQQLTGRE